MEEGGGGGQMKERRRWDTYQGEKKMLVLLHSPATLQPLPFLTCVPHVCSLSERTHASPYQLITHVRRRVVHNLAQRVKCGVHVRDKRETNPKAESESESKKCMTLRRLNRYFFALSYRFTSNSDVRYLVDSFPPLLLSHNATPYPSVYVQDS